MDVNSPHTVDRYVPDMKNAQLVTKEDCEDNLYCGLPYLVPVLTMIWKTHWLPGPRPTLMTPVTMNVLNRTKINGGERLDFRIEGYNMVTYFLLYRNFMEFYFLGPSHMGVLISPVIGVEFDNWSLPTDGPLAGPVWNGRNTYFVYYAYGLEPKPFVFSIDFKVSTIIFVIRYVASAIYQVSFVT